MKEELGLRVAWGDVESVAYILCEKDAALPKFAQQKMNEKFETEGGLGKGAVHVEAFDSSHSPFLSMPEQHMAALERAI